jgi:hypothetical protein
MINMLTMLGLRTDLGMMWYVPYLIVPFGLISNGAIATAAINLILGPWYAFRVDASRFGPSYAPNPNHLGVNLPMYNLTTIGKIAILRPGMNSGGLVYLFPHSYGFGGANSGKLEINKNNPPVLIKTYPCLYTARFCPPPI